MLIPGFTITENIKLNREIAKPSLLSRVFGKNLEQLDAEARGRDARTALDSVGIGIEEYALVKGLPVGHMQFIEIAREIDKKGMKLMVFDEPTAVLTESEAEQLISVMRSIAAKGIAIIFITHRLNEVVAAADNITILRDGKLVTTRKTSETSLVEMAELMIGRNDGEDVAQRAPREEDPDQAEAVLSMEHLVVHMPGERVRDVSLTVKKGEILGVGGLAGQGKLGIPNGVRGLFPAEGKVTFQGEEIPLNEVASVLGTGFAMVSEDRRGVGLLLDQSIEDNIASSALQVRGRFLRGLLPKLSGLRVPAFCRTLIAVLCAVCFVLGIYGLSQFQAVYDRAATVRAFAAQQRAISQRVTGGLAGLEDEIRAAQDAGVNGFFLVAVIALESGWGTSGLAAEDNNLGGITDGEGGYRAFDSQADCVRYMAELLAGEYLAEDGKYHNGVTVRDVGKRYSESGDWADKVMEIMVGVAE
jgi:ABC-type branched-subunit amino acid transport system ATPase component